MGVKTIQLRRAVDPEKKVPARIMVGNHGTDQS
jgi:hypothetical protein